MSRNSEAPDSALDGYQDFREKARVFGALSRLPRSIALAEIGVAPFDRLLDRLSHIWTDDAPSLLIEQVLTRARSDDQQVALLDVLDQLVTDSGGLPPRDRLLADRAVFRLLHTFPATLGTPLARRCVKAGRSLQRQAAYRFYKVHGVDPSVLEPMLNDYRRRPHQEILQVIARDMQAVGIAGPEFLLAELEERYWRTRVVQALMRSDRHKAETLADQYPTEFLWASVREGDESSVPVLRRLMDAHKEDPEFVGWCLWAFSKLGSRPDVAAARSIAETLISAADSIAWGRQGPPAFPPAQRAA